MKTVLRAAALILLAMTSLPWAERVNRHTSSTHPPRARTYASRPYYGGSHHTNSHGGRYVGETNVHHKGGHYVNPRTNNRYGTHKP